MQFTTKQEDRQVSVQIPEVIEVVKIPNAPAPSGYVVFGGLGWWTSGHQRGLCCWLNSSLWILMSLQDALILRWTRMNQLVILIHPMCQLASTRIAGFHVVVPSPDNSWPEPCCVLRAHIGDWVAQKISLTRMEESPPPAAMAIRFPNAWKWSFWVKRRELIWWNKSIFCNIHVVLASFWLSSLRSQPTCRVATRASCIFYI